MSRSYWPRAANPGGAQVGQQARTHGFWAEPARAGNQPRFDRLRSAGREQQRLRLASAFERTNRTACTRLPGRLVQGAFQAGGVFSFPSPDSPRPVRRQSFSATASSAARAVCKGADRQREVQTGTGWWYRSNRLPAGRDADRMLDERVVIAAGLWAVGGCGCHRAGPAIAWTASEPLANGAYNPANTSRSEPGLFDASLPWSAIDSPPDPAESCAAICATRRASVDRKTQSFSSRSASSSRSKSLPPVLHHPPRNPGQSSVLSS